MLLIATLGAATQYPLHPLFLVAALALYGGGQHQLPVAFPFLAPIVLACVNLYAWSGWHFIEIPDFFICTSIAVELLRVEGGGPLPARGKGVWACLAPLYVSLAISTVVALHGACIPFQTNHFDYTAPINALRVLKGWVWALVALELLRRFAARGRDGWHWFLRGVVLALWIVSLVALRERWLFFGLFEFDKHFRVVSTFSSMHVGGSHIGVFLALAIPTAVATALLDPSRRVRIAAGVALLPGAYTLLVTYTRGAWIATGVGVAATLVMAAWQRWQHSTSRLLPWRRLSLPAFALLACAFLVATAWHGRFFQARLRTTPSDLAKRLDIFSETLAMMDDTVWSHLLGMGLGSYPRIYYERNQDGYRPVTREFLTEEGNTFLRSRAPSLAEANRADKLTFGQRVAVEPNQMYRFRVRARSSTPSLIIFEVQERTVLHSWQGVVVAQIRDLGPNWEAHEFEFSTAGIGEGAGPFRPDLVLHFYNPIMGSVVDLDDIEIIDEQGDPLVRNGDFSSNQDFWYVQEQNHVAFQAKNALVGTYFEQGVLGVVGLILLFLPALRTARVTLGSAPLRSISVLGPVSGFLAICLSENPFTVPRLTVLVVMYLGVALAWRHHGSPASRPDPELHRGDSPAMPR
ncbi:MAG: O-antigen ligase family protein [Deferrisomatales bacterium]|nr:O-antigen ligase family protein [Deferrisomatales bacterium]